MDSVQCYSFNLGPLKCLFTTKAAGNFTFARACREDVLGNYRGLEQATGIPLDRIVRVHLDNGTRVVRVGEEDGGKGVIRELGHLYRADALYTNVPGLHIGITTADCFPLILHDPEKKAVGLAHCGWRGIVGRLEQKLLAAMAGDFGTSPKDVVVVIGPGIRECCYRQHDDGLKRAFADYSSLNLVRELPDATYKIDIALALRANLAALGVTKIIDTKLCTGCNEEFFSARKEGFTTGRSLALAAIKY
ncbi:MAG: polyphenol oxidase family protein [Bacillota bacterium]|jgi:YfiH family protein|nr:laccase domain-containing protein [Bacillota bacterium]HOC06304.1 polyphenol oxidase family protein [Bacillota bacterium]